MGQPPAMTSVRKKQLLVIAACLFLGAFSTMVRLKFPSNAPVPPNVANSAAYRISSHARAALEGPFIWVPFSLLLGALLYWSLRRGRQEQENIKLVALALALVGLISLFLTSILKL